MVNSEDGYEPKPVECGEDPYAILSEQFKNVGLEEETMSVCDSNGGWNENESESESESEIVYPLRPGAEDCSFYLRTGSCKFGSTCKFNHPLPLIAKDYIRGKDDELRPTDCKYYFRTGGCKYGETCRFNHTTPKSFQPSPLDLNLLGLPIRPGEIECPYYMRTGSCKYGSECKFDHPDPTTIGGGTESPSFHGNNNKGGSFSPKSTFQASSTSWSSPNGTATPFIPTMLSQSNGVSSITPDWNGYQASVYSPSSTLHMHDSSAETDMFLQYQHQIPAEEFPDRPDQPECTYYLKTGDCKFKFICKYHHPKNRLPKQLPLAFNDMGLPLRPDESICTHYSRYGICKYGPACRYDHSLQLMYPAGSSQSPQDGEDGNDSDGWN